MKRIAKLVLYILSLMLTAGPLSATFCTSPKTMSVWLNTSPFINNGSWTSQSIPAPASCVPMTAIVDGVGATHVFSVDQNGHLIESLQSVAAGSWSVADLTTMLGGTTVKSVPAPISLGGSSVQVFAVSSNGHLFSWTTSQAPGYQAFDLSAIAGSNVSLTNSFSVILAGSTVHVYAGDASSTLYDFIKPLSTQWTAVNVSSAIGRAAFGASPFVYGGNSIQLVSASAIAPPADLLTIVEGINADGTLNGSFSVFDITAAAGAEQVGSVASPALTVGATQQDVAIYAIAASSSRLIEYFKQPNPANWVELNQSSGSISQAHSVLFFPNQGSNGSDGTVKVYGINSLNQLVELTGDPITGANTQTGVTPSTGAFNVTVYPARVAAVNNSGVIEVIVLNP